MIEDDNCNWIKLAAAAEVENLNQVRATAWDEHTHSYRWLMASLLGVNGAACLAIIGKAEIPLYYQLGAAGAYVIGILTALLVPVFGQHSVQKSLVPLQKYIGYWMAVASDGLRNEVFETELNDELRKTAKIALGSRISGWISALLFLFGSVISGIGIIKHAAEAASLAF